MGIIGGKDIFTISQRFKLFRIRSFCSSQSSTHTNRPTTSNSSSNNGSSSLRKYDEQYKALSDLDFMSAAKILFTEPTNKKKFGLDFHLVQLFFVCLPSLAVYLVAQYARREMRKMDAELELKKQAEFEAQAKEMERKAAEEKAAVASNPEILEVKKRLNKIEDAVKQIVLESRKRSGDDQTNGNELIESRKAQRSEADSKTEKENTASSTEGKGSLVSSATHVSPEKQKGETDGGTSKVTKK